MSASDTMRDLLAPVAMISANGLICLALYNRLTAIIGRLRLFHKERFEVQTALIDDLAREEQRHSTDVLLRHLESLERQCGLITRRARWLRNALLMMLLGTMGMLASSLVLGLTHLWPALDSFGLGLFVAGILCMLIGIGFALCELMSSLGSLLIESEGFRTVPPRKAEGKDHDAQVRMATLPAEI